MTDRPTRKAHLEQCRLIEVAMIARIREMTELLRFHAELWEPTPCPPRQP